MKKMIFALTALTFLSPVMPIHAAGEKETTNPLFLMKLKFAQVRKKIAPTIEKIKESFVKNESLALCAIAVVSILGGVLVVAGMEKFRTKKDQKNLVVDPKATGIKDAATVAAVPASTVPASVKEVTPKPAASAKPATLRPAYVVPADAVDSRPVQKPVRGANRIPTAPAAAETSASVSTPVAPAAAETAADPMPAAVPVDADQSRENPSSMPASEPSAPSADHVAAAEEQQGLDSAAAASQPATHNDVDAASTSVDAAPAQSWTAWAKSKFSNLKFW
jgi:hypothetical protein